MDGYNKNSQEGKMSLEDVLELYNGQNNNDTIKYNSTDLGGEITILPEDEKQEIMEMPVPSNVHKRRKIAKTRRRGASFTEASSWFQIICWLNIPVFGFFYMLVLLIRKRTPSHKKNFIIGYIMYKALVWLLAIVLVYWLYKTGLDFIDGMLKYIA